MVITWYGQSCFKITSGDLTIAIDPFSKDIGLTPPRFRVDILLVTHEHYDHANAETIPEGAFLIKGPGEYEVKGVYVEGIPTFHDAKEGKERGINTVYKIVAEDIKLLHLGDFGEERLREETLDAVGDIDIVMVPVGGKYTLDGEGAAAAVKQIEPRFAIPMHYKIPGLRIALDGVDAFLKEMGAKNVEPQDRFAVKKKDIVDEDKTEVVLLKVA